MSLATGPSRTARRGPRHRVAVLGLVLALLVGSGVVDRTLGRTPIVPAAAPAASAASPLGSESSSWYCAGQSGVSGGLAQGTVLVTNAGPAAVRGVVAVVSDRGTRASETVTVPARSQTAVTPSSIEQGTWLATSVHMDGGGVVVSQVVQGPTGWSASACASAALPAWYFASGSTSPGSTLVFALYNPGATPAVVDATFVTAHGPEQPAPFESIVVEPGALVAIDVGTYVQEEGAVASVVSARSGRIVAEELWALSANGQRGLSLRLGAPEPRRAWSLPRTRDLPATTAQAGTDIAVFNPTLREQTVTVSVSPASVGVGLTPAVAPFVTRMAPRSVWHLRTDRTTRVPAMTDFSVAVTSRGGPGVVVDRVLVVPPSAGSPQFGVTPAVAGAPAGRPAHRWIVPALSAGGRPVVAGAVPVALTVANPTRALVHVRVRALVAGSVRSPGIVGDLRLRAGTAAMLGPQDLAPAAGYPLVVEADGPVAVVQELSPPASAGLVTVPGISLG